MLQVLLKAAEHAGVVHKRYFRQGMLNISQKASHHDIVTQADVESQDVIYRTIIEELKKRKIPESEVGFIGEEKLHEVGKHTFVIDPIDGTSNFATGLDEFGVIIGYFNEGVLSAGVIYFPMRGIWAIGVKGKGSYVINSSGNIPLKATGIDLKETFLFSSFSYSFDTKAKIDEKIINLKNLFRGVRCIGSAASEVTYLAENVAGCTMLAGCSIWDISAGKLILEEAGFAMYDWDGNEFEFDLEKPTKKYPFFACHPKYKKEILDKIK